MSLPKIDPLLRAGLEGFEDLKKMIPDRKRRVSRSPPGFPGAQIQNQFPYDRRIKYQVAQEEEAVPVLTSKEEASFYVGVLITPYPSNTPYNKSYRVPQEEAAEFYYRVDQSDRVFQKFLQSPQEEKHVPIIIHQPVSS